MKIGYARVGTDNTADLKLQTQSLINTGCEKVFSELMNEDHNRPEFMAMLEILRDNDIVIVYKIDRIAQSLRGLIKLIELLTEKKIDFISLDSGDNVNTTRPVGGSFLRMAKIFSELEKSMRYNRINVGVLNARAKGVKFGRIPGCKNKKTLEKQNMIETFLREGMSYDWISKELSVSKNTIANIKKSIG